MADNFNTRYVSDLGMDVCPAGAERGERREKRVWCSLGCVRQTNARVHPSMEIADSVIILNIFLKKYEKRNI